MQVHVQAQVQVQVQVSGKSEWAHAMHFTLPPTYKMKHVIMPEPFELTRSPKQLRHAEHKLLRQVKVFPGVNRLRVLNGHMRRIHRQKGRGSFFAAHRLLIMGAGCVVLGLIALGLYFALRHKASPQRCASTADCPARQACVLPPEAAAAQTASKTPQGICAPVRACKVASDCPDKTDSCLAGFCQPNPCTKDGDCMSNESVSLFCDRQTDTCKVGCRSDGDCGAYGMCNAAHVCVEPACRANSDCAQARVCTAQCGTDSACMAQCMAMTQCAIPSVAGETVGTCTWPCPVGTAAGSPCAGKPGFVCSAAGACVASSSGGGGGGVPPVKTCTSSSQCDPPACCQLSADGTTGTCVDAPNGC